MRVNKKKSNRAGFTLVEAMLAVILFAMLFGASMIVYLSGSESWYVNSTQLGLQQELRKGMSFMMEDLRQAGTSSIVDVPADDNWYTSMTFRVAAGISNGNITWSTNTYNYAIGGSNTDQLIRTVGTTTTVFANDVNVLQFRRQSATADIVDINLGVEDMTPTGRTLTVTSTFSIQLRNG